MKRFEIKFVDDNGVIKNCHFQDTCTIDGKVFDPVPVLDKQTVKDCIGAFIDSCYNQAEK